MRREFLNPSNWAEATLIHYPNPDCRITTLNGFRQVTVKKADEKNEIIGSDSIEWLTAQTEDPTKPVLSIESHTRGKELFYADKAVAFINGDSIKIVLLQGNKFILRARINIFRIKI